MKWKVRPYDDNEPFVAICTEDESTEIGFVWIMEDDPEGVADYEKRYGKTWLLRYRPAKDIVADLTAIVQTHNRDAALMAPASPRPWRMRWLLNGGHKGEPSLTIMGADGIEVLEMHASTRGRWEAQEIISTINGRYGEPVDP